MQFTQAHCVQKLVVFLFTAHNNSQRCTKCNSDIRSCIFEYHTTWCSKVSFSSSIRYRSAVIEENLASKLKKSTQVLHSNPRGLHGNLGCPLCGMSFETELGQVKHSTKKNMH
jgi:hypothetical protein